MLSPFKKKLIIGFIKRNIARGYIDIADSQISEHIDDLSEDECTELYTLLENKLAEMEEAAAEPEE